MSKYQNFHTVAPPTVQLERVDEMSLDMQQDLWFAIQL